MRFLAFFIAIMVALVVGNLLFDNAFRRLAQASYLYVSDQFPNGVTGPFSVASVTFQMASKEADGRIITTQLWYPTKGGDSPDPPVKDVSLSVEQDCEKLVGSLALADAPSPFGLLLYAPGNGGNKLENRATSEFLASHGYLILALEDGPAIPLEFGSAERLRETIRLGAEKAQRDAQAAFQTLDRFTQCAREKWAGQVTFDHIGFFGFSLGGSTAAQAAIDDPRIASAVNLDGWLFGPAADGKIEKPYMALLTDDVDLHSNALRKSLASLNPAIHYQADLDAHFAHMQAVLTNRPGNYGFWIHGGDHQSFNDSLLKQASSHFWFRGEATRIKTAKDAYLLAFFDTTVKGLPPSPLLTQNPSPYPKVEVLKDNRQWGDAIASAPIQSELGSK
ncbi:hypothetical protein [Beijerinckia indica]|uniref:Platelet-activating factor acetylhydrolase plasma/intracellular n=1 Tax=Beijerinckia indica subsp. indica (strain ATCC 9039 / DSM 1715 / NCIMB 8712) TaxID=395963 RepID=B2IHH7_BEII9|nr:hypothetical protein [Beijerinckia indica]ACB94498.1 hypothetical protein Bind_0848 [Beijerinckia indica subsp. indica ATCC 9039]